MSWDAFQREVLDALGHSVYRLADAQVETGPDPAVAAASLTPLQRAVLRAADLRDPAAVPVQPLLAAAKTLRADARAKRALWPQLRALRRGTSG